MSAAFHCLHIGYKEVIMHALLRHASDREDRDQKIDQAIAREYRDRFMEYYSKIPYEKDQIREYFAPQII